MVRTLATLLALILLAPLAYADAPGATPPAPRDAAPPPAPVTDGTSSAPGASTPSDAPGADTPDDTEIRSVSAANVTPPKPRMANGLIVIAVPELPARCREVGTRATAANRVQALPARISLANCLSEASVGALQLIDGLESIGEIELALVPSLEVLADVIENGDPVAKVMATHAIAQLYAGMMSRMLRTLPAAAAATPEAQALVDARRAILESMMQPWRDRQLEAYRAVVELAKAHPQLARNPVARGAIDDSRLRIAQARSVAAR